MMNEIVLKKAKELANVLALSPEYIQMRATEDAAAKDENIAEAFGRYSEVQQKIEDLSMKKDPDFEEIGALSRELEQVQQEIQAMPMAQAMQRCRQAFTDMMAAVNEELSKVLNPNFGKESKEGCTGNCGSCGGHCHG